MHSRINNTSVILPWWKIYCWRCWVYITLKWMTTKK